jgi:hypothetical protein
MFSFSRDEAKDTYSNLDFSELHHNIINFIVSMT